MIEGRSPEDICSKFNSVRWHDSKLVCIQISHTKEDLPDDVYFEIELLTNPHPTSHQRTKARLIMKDCTIIKLDLDLAGKFVCAHDISEAFCTQDSPLKHQTDRELKYEEKPLAEYLHFTISLIPPGGEINLFAKDFELLVESEK